MIDIKTSQQVEALGSDAYNYKRLRAFNNELTYKFLTQQKLVSLNCVGPI